MRVFVVGLMVGKNLECQVFVQLEVVFWNCFWCCEIEGFLFVDELVEYCSEIDVDWVYLGMFGYDCYLELYEVVGEQDVLDFLVDVVGICVVQGVFLYQYVGFDFVVGQFVFLVFVIQSDQFFFWKCFCIDE